MPVCEVCGSRQIEQGLVAGEVVSVCGLCGEVQGDATTRQRLEERREAIERGFDPLVYPLVCALEAIPEVRVEHASAGRPGTAEYPFVFLRLGDRALSQLERLLTSLEMANRTTHRRWVVECSLQRGLLFILRPRFWKAILEISETDVLEARQDLPILAQLIARDVSLGWWRS